MIKIKVLKDFTDTDGTSYRKDEIVDVDNNTAYFLQEKSVAKVYQEPVYQRDKEMKLYKTK